MSDTATAYAYDYTIMDSMHTMHNMYEGTRVCITSIHATLIHATFTSYIHSCMVNMDTVAGSVNQEQYFEKK